MRRGLIDIKVCKENDLEIIAKDWLEPNVKNTGEVSMQIEGYTLKPGESIGLGPNNIIISQNFKVAFTGSESGKKQYTIIYCTLKKENCQ